MKKISVIGLGFVGLTLAVTNAQKGFLTIGVDNNKEKIENLNKWISEVMIEYPPIKT